MWSNAARSILSDAISRGRPPLEATLYAGDQAMADYIAGKIPLTKLLRGVKVSSPFFKTVIGQFVLDSGSDQFARHWQDFNSWAVLHPERTFEGCLKERPNAVLEAFGGIAKDTGPADAALCLLFPAGAVMKAPSSDLAGHR